MSNYNLTAIKMNVDLGSTKKVIDQYNALVKQLETKHVKLDIDVSSIAASVGLATQEIEAMYKKMASESKKASEETQKAMKFATKNGIIDNSSIDKFKQSLSQVRSDIKEISNVKVTYGKNESGNGLGKIDSAVVTYTNNINKLVTETMAWADTTDKATGEQMKQWQTISVVVNDNKKAIEQLGLATEKASSNMKNKLDNMTIGKGWAKDLKEFKDLETMINAFDPKNIKMLKSDTIDIADAFKKLQNVMKQSNVGDAITKDFDRASKSLEKFKTSMDTKINGIKIGGDSGWATQLQQYQDLKVKFTELKNFKLDTTNVAQYTALVKEVSQAYTKCTEEIKRVKNESNELSKTEAFGQNVVNKVRGYNTQLEILRNKYGDIEAHPLFKTILADVTKLNNTPPTEFSNSISIIDNNLKKLKAEMSSVSKVGTGIFSNLASTVKSAFSFMTGATLVYGFANQIRQIPKIVEEVDTSLVEFNKVAKISQEQLESFTDAAYVSGERLAKTGNQVIQASTEFVKAGYNIQEATSLAESTLLSMNVGSGMGENLDVAVSSMIATLKGFGMEASQSSEIVDKMSKVADTCAVSYIDLANGVERSSAVLKSGDFTFEESLGALTGVYEVTRNMEKSATGLNTIMQRLRGIGDEGEFSEEALKGVEKKLYEIAGIKLKDDMTGQLRSTFDVLEDLSSVWNKLSKNQQAILGESVSGKRQAVILQALMQNWQGVEKAIESTSSAMGYADEVNEVYLDSVNGKMAAVKSNWEKLATGFMSSDMLKGVLETTSGILQLIEACGGLQTVVVAATLSFAAFKAVTKTLNTADLTTGVASMIAKMVGYKVATDAATASTIALSIAQKALIGGAVTAAVMAIGGAIKYMSESAERAEQNFKNLNEEIASINKGKDEIDGLAKRYTELAESQSLNNEEQKEFIDIQNKLHELMPEINGYYDEAGNYIIIETDLVKKLNDVYEKLIETKLEERRVQAESLANNLENDVANVGKQLEYEKATLKLLEDRKKELINNKSNFSDDEFAYAMGNYDNQIANVKGSISELNATMKDMNDKSKTSILTLISSTREWNSATNEQKKALQDLIVATNDSDKLMWYLKNSADSVGDMITSLEKAKKAQIEFNNGNITIAEKMSILEDISMRYGISLEALNGITEEHNEVSDDVVDATNEAEEALSELVKKQAESSAKTLGQIESYELLLLAIEKLNNGQQLSGEEIGSLTTAYTTLTPKIDEATGQMYLEVDALTELAGKQGEMSQQGIVAHINLTKQAAVESAKRIGLMYDEILAINSAADAYAILARSNTSLTGGYRPVGIDDETWTKSAANTKIGVNKYIKEIASLYEKASKVSSSIETYGSGGKGKGNGSGKGDKPSDKFKLELEKIQAIREDIEYEIALLQEKMNLAELVGDTKTFNELSDKMTVLKDELRGISEIQIGEFEGLAQLYKENEQLGELESLIADARKQGYIDEQEYIRHTIDLLNQRYDIEKRLYDEKLRIINLEQALYEQGTDEYEAMEVQKIDLLVQLQQSYMDKIRALKDEGLRDDNEDIRRYVDMWKDAQEELLSIDLAMQKRRRQAEIDSLKQQQDQLKSISDAKKKILDETIAMIKAEEKARDDAAKKQIKNEIDNMKKLADARKKELQRQKDERRYQKDVDKSNEEISAIQRELDKLMFDNSEWAVAERLKLEQQLKEKTEALEDKQWENKIDKQIDAIDEQVKLFEDQKNYELEIIEKNAMSEVEIRKKALAMMDKKNGELYKKLQKYLEETGKMGKAEFESLWSVANTGLEQFGINTKSTLTSLDAMYVAMKRLADQADRLANSPIGGYKPPSGSGNNVDSKKIQQMIDNSQAWAKATTQAERDRLAKENQRLGAELGLYYNASTGKWYRDAKHTIPAWHTGLSRGQVGTGLKPNELIAKLTEDEWVFTGKQFDNLTNNLKGVIGDKRGNVGDIVLNLYGTITEGAKPLLKEWTKDIEKICYKVVNRTI